MNDIVFVLFGVLVAAFVGGITNHFAIKMLFHPRKPVVVGGKKLPFTPGLIPKRKQEIGASLGKVVAEYLVTADGLVEVLGKPEFRRRLEGFLERLVTGWSGREETLDQLALRFAAPEQWAGLKERLAAWIRSRTEEGLRGLWEARGLSGLTLSGIVPGWNEGRREELLEWATDTILQSLKDELRSPAGDRLLRELTTRFLDQAGGFLGALAGIFMDEDKVAVKIKTALIRQLDSPGIRRTVAGMLGKKLEQWGEVTLEEWGSRLLGEPPLPWLLRQAASRVPLGEWLDRAGEHKLSELLGPCRERLLAGIPGAAERLLDLLRQYAGEAVAAVDLPQLVEAQVAKFPIERLEEIILSVSGKEFRAITWLGVLLGGLIGLVQSLVTILFR
jgi:uncharacterized membrane protein YheB (UPF0754 family)